MNAIKLLSELKINLEKLNIHQRTLFLWCIGSHLIEDYILFSKEVNWGESSVLKESLNELWLISINENSSNYISNNKQKIESLLNQIELVTPDFDGFMEFNILNAFNACSVIFYSLKYCLNNKEDFIEIIMDNLVESIKYKVELIILSDPVKNIYYAENDCLSELETEILNHSFLKEELTRFQDYLTLISMG